MKKIIFVLFSALLLSGCRNIDYVGQKFDPTPMSEEVVYYENRKEVPPDKYTIIGRFTIQTGSEFTNFEMIEMLLEKGREYGGDAVCFVDRKSIKLGAYTTNEEEFGAPNAAGYTELNPETVASKRDIFGNQTKPLQGETRRREETRVRALLLKDRKTTQKLLEER